MPTLPAAPGFDATLALLRDPYRWIGKTARRLGCDAFHTRLFLQPVVCLTGPAAATLFYQAPQFSREGAALPRIVKTLVGAGGVQGLDGAAHRHRKALFLEILSPPRIAALAALVQDAWPQETATWRADRRVDFYATAQVLLMRCVCAWAEVPLPAEDLPRRTREIAALFDAAGSIGPRHWGARRARRRSEAWLRDLIEEVRTGQRPASSDSALRQVAFHRDLGGDLLPLRVAAVELLNVLRPTVAVAVYLVQALHALCRNPACLADLRTGGSTETAAAGHRFVQEVRRWYPFFPATMARITQPIAWRGFDLPVGRRVLLDLYGTNHDARAWHEPEAFVPERFRHHGDRDPGLVPQGGGDPSVNHRCPGEPLAIALMEATVAHFATEARYRVPVDQDLELDYARLPCLPHDRLQVTGLA